MAGGPARLLAGEPASMVLATALATASASGTTGYACAAEGGGGGCGCQGQCVWGRGTGAVWVGGWQRCAARHLGETAGSLSEGVSGSWAEGEEDPGD
jgi:hypothetical protein